MRKILCPYAIILLAVSLLPYHLASAIQVDLVPKEKELVEGQPIIVVLEIAVSSATVIDLGGDRIGNLQFTITDPSGQKTTAHLDTSDFTVSGRIEITPGRPYHQSINLTSLSQIANVGHYSISVEILGAISDSTSALASREPAMIWIKPKDDNRLKQICEELRLQIETTASSKDRSELASELASIHDPIAVPAIRSLLGKKLGIDDELIDSLQKIGDLAAIEALEESLANPDPDTARFARAALANIESTTKSEPLRRRAREALQNSKDHPEC